MKKIIGWWSGGVTSAVSIKLAIDLYGKDNMEVIFIDTHNEDDDTYRFMKDCEKWYKLPIKSISSIKHKSVKDVWYRYKALNNAKGAVCSSEMKRQVRETWEKTNEWSHQIFGFDITESGRARGMKLNHGHTNPIFPLLFYGLSKKDCLQILQDDGIDIPRAYKLGFHNNNCLGNTPTTGGCVQGGIGYWQKFQVDFKSKFDAMSKVEHEITDLKGRPVTMLKDQGKDGGLVFLKPHPDYPHIKDISMMKGRPPKPLVDCNGFCGINDLSERSSTESEINYQTELWKNI